MASRRSLFDLLIIHLGEALNLGPVERLFHPPISEPLYGLEVWRFADSVSRHESQTTTSVAGEDSKAIHLFVDKIANDSECKEMLSVGMCFGKLVFAIEEFESYVWNVENAENEYIEEKREKWLDHLNARLNETEASYMAEFADWFGSEARKLQKNHSSNTDLEDGRRANLASEFEDAIADKREEIRKQHLGELEDMIEFADVWEPDVKFDANRRARIDCTTKQLLDTQAIQYCHHAASLLERLLGNVPEYSVKEGGKITRLEALRESTKQIRHAQTACWIAFGEVLGIFHDQDTESKLQDATRVASRSFQLLPADSPDRVLKQLVELEAAFNHAAENDRTPEETVQYLSPVIESLAKRVWPEEFMPRPGEGFRKLSTILISKIQVGSQLEQRFAAIAIPLHKRYRNDAVHDPDGFKCSSEEARYFLAGIRTLVDLWRQIKY